MTNPEAQSENFNEQLVYPRHDAKPGDKASDGYSYGYNEFVQAVRFGEVPGSDEGTWLASPVVDCSAVASEMQYTPPVRLRRSGFPSELHMQIGDERMDIKPLLQTALANVGRQVVTKDIIYRIGAARPQQLFVSTHENGMRTLSKDPSGNDQWAQWMERAGLGNEANNGTAVMVAPPEAEFKKWRTEAYLERRDGEKRRAEERLRKVMAEEALKRSVEEEIVVGEDEKWSPIFTGYNPGSLGSSERYYRAEHSTGHFGKPLEAGTKLGASFWDVSLSEDKKTFILTQEELGKQIQLDALGVRMAVDGNQRLSKRVLNPDNFFNEEYVAGVFVGRDAQNNLYFEQDQLKELIYPRLDPEQIDGDEMLVKGRRWVTEDITDKPDTEPVNEDFMVDRHAVLKKVKEEYGDGVRLMRTYLSDESGRKYEYFALQLPIGADAEGNEQYDAFVECPEIDNAAFFVPYDKGDWREVIIGQTKGYAEAHGAIRQPHPAFDEEWDQARKAQWREKWENTVLELIFREHKAFQKSA